MSSDNLTQRIATLQGEIEQAERALRISQGKLKNLDPDALTELEAEQKRLDERVDKLRDALLKVSLYLALPKSAAEAQQQELSLKTAAVESFKKENIPRDLWKSLES